MTDVNYFNSWALQSIDDKIDHLNFLLDQLSAIDKWKLAKKHSAWKRKYFYWRNRLFQWKLRKIESRIQRGKIKNPVEAKNKIKLKYFKITEQAYGSVDELEKLINSRMN